MSDNGDLKLVLKVELEDKKFKVTFGALPTLFLDRAIRLANLELDNIIIGQQDKVDSDIIQAPKSVLEKLRGR